MTNEFLIQNLIHIGYGLLCGALIALSYIFSSTKKKYSINFAITTVCLPAIIAVVIILVGSDYAKAISIVGIFTLVRFRSVPGDSRDILYIFFTMAAGLAVGMDCFAIAFALVIIISLVFVILERLSNYVSGSEKKMLKISVPEDMNFKGAFDDLFEKYLLKYTLSNVKTTNMGTLYALTYEVVPKKDLDIKAFIDELRIRNGNLNIIYGEAEELGDPIL